MEQKVTLTKEEWIDRARAALVKAGYNDTPSMKSYAACIMESFDPESFTPEEAVRIELESLE